LRAAPGRPAEQSNMSDDTAIADELRESRLRSILKAVTYRVTGTLTTAAITFIVTGEILTAFAVGVIEPFFKIVIYYLHERIWQQVPRGHVRRWLEWLRRPRPSPGA
jgi:uncharacterized membrane protein